MYANMRLLDGTQTILPMNVQNSADRNGGARWSSPGREPIRF